MKPVIEPAEPQIEDRAALLVDPAARADAALDHQVAAAQRRARERAGVDLDDDDAGHHVLAGRPADAPVDLDLRAVDQTAAEVAERALEMDLAARQDADPQRVLRARVLDRDLPDALLVDEPAQLEVDLAGRQVPWRRTRALSPSISETCGGLGVRLREPARVVADPPLAYRCHTSTSRS